jgi:hypothetical protein
MNTVKLNYFYMTALVALITGTGLGYNLSNLQYKKALDKVEQSQQIAKRSLSLAQDCMIEIHRYLGLVDKAKVQEDYCTLPEVY